MNNSGKNNPLLWNSALWLAAMVLPALLSIALPGTRFPWQVIVPMLLIGPMLASNKMLRQAMKESTVATPN
jgi:hypothetical protein